MRISPVNYLFILFTAFFLQAGSSKGLAAEGMAATDFSGLWVISNRSIRGYLDENFENLEPEEYLTPAAVEITENVRPAFDPSAMCLPSMPRHLVVPIR